MTWGGQHGSEFNMALFNVFPGAENQRERGKESKARLEGEHLPQPAGGLFFTPTGKDRSRVDRYFEV